MKKFDSVFLLQFRLVIFKLLLLIAAVSAINIILFYTAGLKYSDYGFDILCVATHLETVTKVSFILCTLLLAIFPLLSLINSLKRYRIMNIRPAAIFCAGVLSSVCLYLLWYAFTMINIFFIAWLFTKNSGYLGGANGIYYSCLTSSVIHSIIPLKEPAVFAQNIGKLLLAAVAVNIPCAIYFLMAVKEGKKENNE